jgi:membrane protein DedA with SNARE-associated domain
VVSLILGWLREHLYPVVFLGAVVDAVGIPFPGRLLLITAGSLVDPASAEDASPATVIALATLGTVVGDHVWYVLGRFNGRRLFDLYCRLLRLSEASVGAADRLLRRFGGLALVFGRLAATLRLALVPLAVSRGMSYRRFVALDTLGAALWVTGFVWLGRAAGAVTSDHGLMMTVASIGALATVGAVVSVLARRRLAVGGAPR